MKGAIGIQEATKPQVPFAHLLSHFTPQFSAVTVHSSLFSPLPVTSHPSLATYFQNPPIQAIRTGYSLRKI
jgi:hypothetical protein